MLQNMKFYIPQVVKTTLDKCGIRYKRDIGVVICDDMINYIFIRAFQNAYLSKFLTQTSRQCDYFQTRIHKFPNMLFSATLLIDVW